MTESHLLLHESSPLDTSECLSSTLDGRDGILRERFRPNLLGVDTDVEAIRCWLEKAKSARTRRSYEKEVDRLLRWALFVRKTPVSSLMTPDYLAYRSFLLDPPSHWCGPKRARKSGQWRPFTGTLSTAGADQALVVIQALLVYLVKKGYLTANVLAGEFSRPKISAYREAFFTEEQQALLVGVETLPKNTPREIANYERQRWMLRLMLATGLRIAEVAEHRMGHIREAALEGKKTGWRCNLRGKGDKLTWVPIPDALLQDLMRYRQFLGLPPYPNFGDPADRDFPLVANITGQRPVSDRRLAQMLKAVFELGAQQLDQDHPHRAEKLRQAMPHLLRHTAITNVGRHADVRIQQRFARHENIHTTMRYQTLEDKQVHEAAERAHTDMDQRDTLDN